MFRGERVALKLCDLWQHPEHHEEILTEVRTYLALEELEGHALLKLISAGYTAGGLFIVVTELAGSSFEVKKLRKADGYPFLHRDIRQDSVLITTGLR